MRWIVLTTLLLASACGQFNTYKYYADVGTPSDSSQPACEVVAVLTIDAPETMALVAHEPAAWGVHVRPGNATVGDLFIIAGGELPAGLLLDAHSGRIMGFPESAGSYPIEVSLKTEDACVSVESAWTTIEVAPPCEEDGDCPSVDTPQTVTCQEPGRCVVSALATACPGALQLEVGFELSDAPTLPMSKPQEVMAHHPLTKEALAILGLSGYTHQLLFSGESGVWTLPYRLAHDWPLPLRPGETVHVEADPLRPALLVLDGQGGTPTTLLFDGLVNSGYGAEGPGPLSVERLSMACPILDGSHHCGPRNHDMLRFQLADQTLHLTTDDITQLTWLEDPYELTVAQAYTHLPTQFSCPYTTPSWASFQLFPLATCPIALMAEPAMSPVLWSAHETIPVILDATPSLAHGDASIAAYEWKLTRQPYPGLNSLVDPGAGKGTSNGWFAFLEATAVGTYDVRLEVVDSQGQDNCVPGLMQIETSVPAEVDLRLELVWWTEDDSLDTASNLDLLMMHPTYSSVLDLGQWPDDAWTSGTAQKWVCSAANPSPSNWAALPEGNEGLCRVADGHFDEGRPEVLTVRDLDRDQKTNRYPVAVAAPATNDTTVYAGLRVYISGLPAYETTRQPIAPGQVWHAGHINVEFMKFVPEKNGK